MACETRLDTPMIGCCLAPDFFIQRVYLRINFYGHGCVNHEFGIPIKEFNHIPLYALRTNTLNHYPPDPVNDGVSTHRILCDGSDVFGGELITPDFSFGTWQAEVRNCTNVTLVERNDQGQVTRRYSSVLSEDVDTTPPAAICESFLDEAGQWSGARASMRFVDQQLVANPTTQQYVGGSSWSYKCGQLTSVIGSGLNLPGSFHAGSYTVALAGRSYSMVKSRILIFRGRYFGCLGTFVSGVSVGGNGGVFSDCVRREFFDKEILHPPAVCIPPNPVYGPNFGPNGGQGWLQAGETYRTVITDTANAIGHDPQHVACCNSAP